MLALQRLPLVIAAFFLTIVCIGEIASASTIVGRAVGAIGDDPDTQGVGTIADGAFIQDAIEFYVPLSDSASGTYGTGTSCGGSGIGTCSDTGYGIGGYLDMIISFAPVHIGQPYTLEVLFEDQDFIGVNDPWYWLEYVDVQDRDGNSLAGGLIENITSPYVTGDADTQQLLSLDLGILSEAILYLVLHFESETIWGDTNKYLLSNTPEYLIATIQPVPIPAALPLFATALAGVGFFGWSRKRSTASI